MDLMEEEMKELKTKMASLESSLNKSNEEIGKKFTVIEQQQQAANVDIKNMFSQLIAEMSTVKATVIASNCTGPAAEEQRKKPRVDSPALMNS
jgi:hypothetical protein